MARERQRQGTASASLTPQQNVRRRGQGRGIPVHATLSDTGALDPTAAVEIMNYETTLAPMRLRTTHAAWTLFRRGGSP